MTGEFELAVRDRRDLAITAEYDIDSDGTQRQLTRIQESDGVALEQVLIHSGAKT